MPIPELQLTHDEQKRKISDAVPYFRARVVDHWKKEFSRSFTFAIILKLVDESKACLRAIAFGEAGRSIQTLLAQPGLQGQGFNWGR